MKILLEIDASVQNVLEILGLIIINDLQDCISDLKTLEVILLEIDASVQNVLEILGLIIINDLQDCISDLKTLEEKP